VHVRNRHLLLALLIVLTSVTACTTTVTGSPTSGDTVVTGGDSGDSGVDPSFVKGTDGSSIDRLAAAVVTDVENFWRASFPSVFDKEWTPLEGGFYSVDTTDYKADPPPCAQNASDVEGNAFYCPTDDVIAWDRAALLPVLRERFGEASVMLVLAHEIGHAVQDRAGLTLAKQRKDPERYPTILIEAQADCYAGTFVKWVSDGKAEHLHVDKNRLDSALESLITFRDPTGTSQTDEGAHGDAFDRVSAFQDGFAKGAKLCRDMSVDNRTFTQRGFNSDEDAATGGNVSFDEIIGAVSDNLDTYFGQLVTGRGGQWRQPELQPTDATPDCADGDQGPVAYCPDTGTIDYDGEKELPKIHTDIGDYATGTLVASRYGMAAMADLSLPVKGGDTQHGSVCLAGAFTGFLLSQDQLWLAPGDLDEAVQVLLAYDYAARDVTGAGTRTGFERVADFRKGVTEGDKACF